MAHDDFRVFVAEKLCRFFGNEFMRRAVETVLSDFVFIVHLVRNSVHIRLCRHRRVERGIEHRDHGNAFHNLSATLYASDFAGHMKRT